MAETQKTKPTVPQKPTPPPTQKIQESLKPTRCPQGRKGSGIVR